MPGAGLPGLGGVVRWSGCGQAEEGFKKSQPHGDGLHHIFLFLTFLFQYLSFFILDFAGTILSSNDYIWLTLACFAIPEEGAMA